MEQRVEGKVAIVTGAAQGIGKGVALHLAREGADLVVVDIDLPKAEQVAQEIRTLQRRAMPYHINLAHIAEIQPMVDAVVREFGKIDILVNSAAVVQSKFFLDVTEEDWDRITDINQKGLVFCIQAVAKQMIAQVPEAVKAAGKTDHSYGKIVNFSSISGRRGRAYQ
ncbi:SDR family NAD(P)-dependent oxidoreductase, partial [candidate division KSB3 bacterium]|nr:SDR family NAD(P)-dependent oxidoreductase [candidate division KSB3 bacterium]MBD3325889.1 SDR family NAD(P)-dependent oxidoreductase [candidate division KSB3 bacterium]